MNAHSNAQTDAVLKFEALCYHVLIWVTVLYPLIKKDSSP